MTHQPVQILLVEDNEADVFLTREALRTSEMANVLHVVSDGVEALEFLHRRGPFADAPLPDLVLLDLNLPRVDGREVLNEIKNDPELRHIPIVVLTSSAAEQDVLKAYDLHANCYIVKPVDFRGLMQVVRSIQHFWLQVVKLPSDAPESL